MLDNTYSTMAGATILKINRQWKEGQRETGSNGEQRKKAIRAADILFMLEILKLFYWEPVDSSTN